MRVALVNPPWSFDGSIYFGCREPHLPLELGYARALLERAATRPACSMRSSAGADLDALTTEVAAFRPEVTVVDHGAELPVLALRAARAPGPHGRPRARCGRTRSA